MKKNKKTKRKYPLHSYLEDDLLDADSSKESDRLCECEGCEEKGLYPAPKSRDKIRDYLWFCLEHVREYNQSWDYYNGMNPAAIEASRRADVTWDRPSWSFTRTGEKSFLNGQFKDPFGIFGEGEDWSDRTDSQSFSEASFEREEIQAMAQLNLSYPFSEEQLKVRYKTLAKQYHPDLNQGSKKAEEAFKKVSLAYSILKKNLS